MRRLNYNVIILIIIITIFGFIFPFLSWIEEGKISAILQSLSILTVYVILFFQTFKEKLKSKKSLTIAIQYIENLIELIYEYHLNLAEKVNSIDIDEFKKHGDILNSEISIFKDWYKEDLKKLHCFVRESHNLLSILIQFQDSRCFLNNKGIFKQEKGKLVENITFNLKEREELIKRLYQLI